MVRFIAIVASALSLLSFTRATAIEARNCEYFCPELDNDGNSLDTRTDLLTTFLCLYLGGSLSGCEYNTVSI
jgi:hypothetical protein